MPRAFRRGGGRDGTGHVDVPEDKWGTVIQNYTQLYGNPGDYNNQLKALEAARTKDPKNPALRFLLGFHYGYLGYPKEAVRELGKSVELEPRDAASRKLHDIFAAKIGASPVGPPEMPKPPEGSEPKPAGDSTGVGTSAPTTSSIARPTLRIAA